MAGSEADKPPNFGVVKYQPATPVTRQHFGGQTGNWKQTAIATHCKSTV